MKIITLEAIKKALPGLDLMSALEQGFVSYSEGRAVVPPVGELIFTDPPGDVHIKYGYVRGDAHYVIKVASGFYRNPESGLPSGNGLMLLFSRLTGAPVCLLLDEGYLTDVRTAVAGAIAARYLAPARVGRIGIVGTGVQARLQLRYLSLVSDCRQVVVWGRRPDRLELFRTEMQEAGYAVETTLDARDLASRCNLIVTATISTAPLLRARDILPGTHITAVGADAAHKQELDPAILKRADLVVADSISQCRERGEIAHALREGLIEQRQLVELGNVIAGKAKGRTSEGMITVADLTGVAVQDIQIANAVFQALPGMALS